MSGRRQGRRSVGLLLDVIVALLLGFTLAVPPAAWVASRQLPLSVAGAPADLSVAAKAAPVQLRTLPAFDSGGMIPRAFPDGRGIADPRRLRSAIESQARSLGVDDLLPSIWQVLDDPGIPAEAARHPLRFGALDDVLDEVVTPDFAGTHAVELNDLAVLFIYDAAYSDAGWAGKVAYSLLNRIRVVSDRCEPQLNLAFLLTLEPFPDDDQVLAEFRRAERACGSDLTPLWYLGQFQIRRSYVEVLTNSRSDLRKEEINARPVRTFRELQQRQPTSPLGWVGEAEAWLRVAEAANGFGVTPFTARQQFRRADDLLIRAGASDDPAVRVGRARALIGQGRAAEAGDLMTAVLGENPSSLRIQVLTVEMLERAHRFAEALEVADRPPSMPSGFSLAMDDVDGLPPESYLTYQLFDAVPVMISIATTGGFGGGGLDDYGFIPQVRPGAESTVDGLCRVASTVRDLIAVGRPADALALADGGADVNELVPGRSCIGTSGFLPRVGPDEPEPPQTLAAIAALELEDEAALPRWTRTDGVPATEPELSDLMDARQNLWRFAGDLHRAARAARHWSERLPADPMPHDRLGEIAFLAGDYATAAAEFQQAQEGFAVRSQNETIEDIYGVELSSSLAFQARALLKLGAAQHLGGDDTAATASLIRAYDLGRRGLARAEETLPWRRIVIDAQRQIGDISLLRGDDAEALAHYRLAEQALIERNADEAANRTAGEFANFVDNGALQNNMSLAYARDGDHRRAVELGQQALQRDRSNPVFVETLAFAQQSAGDAAGAIAGYQVAVTEDPTLFTAQNNRGVLLAQAGRFPEAVQAFRAAIGANQDYATAWRNLGVVIPRSEGLTGWLTSLGALGRANIIEADYRGAAPELTFDTTVYATQLDLSKPLGPEWSFATSIDRQTPPLTIFMIMALAARMLAALVADQLGSQLGGVLVQPRATVLRRLRFARLRLPAAWAVALTVALAALTSGDTSAQPRLELILVAVGTLALIGLYLRSRSWFATRLGAATTHVAWSPAMVVGIAGALLNFAFPPLPVAELPARTPAEQKARLVGPITLAVVGAALAALAVATGVPLSRTLAAAALAALGYVMLPVAPLDGVYVRRRVPNLLITVALAIGTCMFALKWV